MNLRTKITRKQICAILISYLGIVVAFWNEINFQEDNVVLGVFLIFLSALTFAAYLVGSGWLIPKFGVVLFTSYAMILSTICVCIHYLLVDRTSIFQYDSEVYFLGFLMAIISTLIPSFLVSLAIKKMSVTYFSIIGSNWSNFNNYFSLFFFRRKIILLSIFWSIYCDFRNYLYVF